MKPAGTWATFSVICRSVSYGDARFDRLERKLGAEPGPGAGEPAVVGRRLDDPALDFLEHLLHLVGERLGDRLGLAAGQVAGHHELLGVELADADPVLDLLVHERLGERGLVALVVPVPAVADHVDHHVLAESSGGSRAPARRRRRRPPGPRR